MLPTDLWSPGLWTYAEHVRTGGDLSGYHVEAMDGGIGKIDEATYTAGTSFLVVDTGPWIFGRKVLLPAGIVDYVDHDEQQVFVNRTKDEITDAPEYDDDDDDSLDDEAYRSELDHYYSGLVAVGPEYAVRR
jgi:hypothetical protein